MTPDRTEQLIVELAAHMTPAPRLAPVSVRMARWLVVAGIATAVAIWIIGARADLSLAMAEPNVLVSLALAFLASASAAALSLRLSVPGAEQSAWMRWTPFVIVGVWVGALLQWSQSAGAPISSLVREPLHAACVLRVVALSLIPAAVLLRSARQGFVLDRGWTATLAVLAGSGLAALAVQLLCPIDRPAHLVMSHALPAIALLAAAPLAAKALRTAR
ncbi:MAG: DUF1109 family protein [Acidobacteria bacterium]|nr:DUF1109 family protein [Acidobacteriota bacterium]